MIKKKDNNNSSQQSKREMLFPNIKNKLINNQQSQTKPLLLTDKIQQIIREQQSKIMKQYNRFQHKIHKNTSILTPTIKQDSTQTNYKSARSTSLNEKKDKNEILLNEKGCKNEKRQRQLIQDRYLKNERLCMQLNLFKQENQSDISSDQQHIKHGLMIQDNYKQTIPEVYVMKRNASYNLINDKDVSVYLTEDQMDHSKMEIIEKMQSYPSLPNISLHKTLHVKPNQEKYIKQKFVGNQAVSKFYNRYKNIDKIRDMQTFKLQFNPITAILTILQHYNIPPKRMEVIKVKGQQAILDLRNCGIGRGVSIKAISEIIEKVKVFEQIDLSYNSIHSDLCDIIIPNLCTLKRINLSYNKIGRRGMQILNNIISNDKSGQDIQFQQLNLESNNINDTAIGPFFSNILQMNYLMILNLSKNYLGNFSALRLKSFLLEDNNLTQLYLHWTQLGQKGTKLIFEGLSKNYCLRVLDLSWNQIGLDGAIAFCNCNQSHHIVVKNNDTLVHLDVSFCEIDQTDTKKIANALKSNKTIYGLHYQGNLGYIDYKGYLHPTKKQNKILPFSIRAGLVQRIDSINIQRHYYSNYNQKTLLRSICWICQGWQQKYFKISKYTQDKLCFIHFDFQKYTGVVMNDRGQYFQIIRMCPPKAITYFHTKVSHSNKFSHSYSSKNAGQTMAVAYNDTIPDFMIEKTKFSDVYLQHINKMASPKYYTQIFNEDYLTKFHCMPRTNDMKPNNDIFDKQKQPTKKAKRLKKPRKNIKLQKQIRLRQIPESFISLFNFNKNIGEGQQYIQTIKNCVEFDLTHSKVLKLIKNQNQLKDIRNILENNYDLFQKIYYYLNNNNPNVYGVYSISENKFQKFVQEQKYQSKRVTLAKIRLKLITCLANHQGMEGEINGFYRPQFFQFLLRLAIEKWCQYIPKKQDQTEQQKRKRQKYPLSISEAFAKMIKTLRKYEGISDPNPWRQANLTNYQINIVLKSYSHILQKIYQKYAGFTQKNMNTKVKKKLFLDEFKTMILQAGLRKTKQALKDLEIAYRNSKKLQVQDGISDTGITYMQFLQAFCRFADGLYLKPIGSQNNPLWQHQVITLDEIPLFLKVQKLIKDIYSKNYDLKSKKNDQLLQLGLFPQQVDIMMKHFKQKYSQNRQSLLRKTMMLKLVKMNSLSTDGDKITLKFLISLLKLKADQIQQQNKQKMAQIQQQKQDQKQQQDDQY